MGDIGTPPSIPSIVVKANSFASEIARFVEEKNLEVERLQKERDEMSREMGELKKRNEELLLENGKLESKQKELVDTYTTHLNEIDKTVERLGNENGELEKKLEEEKRVKEQVIMEYCEIYGRRALLMDLVRERIQKSEEVRRRSSLGIEAGKRAE